MVAGFRQNPRMIELFRTVRSMACVTAILGPLVFGLLGCAQAKLPQQSSEQSTPTVSRQYTAADVAANEKVQLPSWISGAEAESYQFALAHPEMLQYIPCYCGCGMTAKHKSNLDCYIRGVDDKGAVIFDHHAISCGVCADITTDVKRLSSEGKSLVEIRSYVDERYSQVGPGTETPLPPS